MERNVKQNLENLRSNGNIQETVESVLREENESTVSIIIIIIIIIMWLVVDIAIPTSALHSCRFCAR